MKVEIELSDLEKLRSEVGELHEKNRELRQKLSARSDEQYYIDVKENALTMFIQLNQWAFQQLGFDESPYTGDSIGGLFHWGKGKYDWQNNVLILDPEKISVEMGAYITGKFKRAFLNINVKTD